MYLLIDNYDSFSYNIKQYFEQLGETVLVQKNDEEILSEDFEGLIISPGPGSPQEAGKSKDFIKKYYKEKKILGICLGMQCMAEVFSSQTLPAKEILHGKTSLIQHNKKGLFAGLKNPLRVARYHSLMIDEQSLEACEIIARTEKGEPMALWKKDSLCFGLQFHPESFMSEEGLSLIKNFIDLPSCLLDLKKSA